MKKLAIAALALALSAGVNANPVASDNTSATGATGAVNSFTLAAGAAAAAAAVVGGVVSNNRKSVVVEDPIKPEEPVCDDGSKPDNGGVCTTTTVTVTVTGTGTNTSTTTITVPVTYTVF